MNDQDIDWNQKATKSYLEELPSEFMDGDSIMFHLKTRLFTS